jgi:hypothetical protein
MSTVINGRFTADMKEPIVVFLIGMRINRLLALRRWLPIAVGAMPRMLRELMTQPELGMISYRLLLGWRRIEVVQYWRSFEQLEHYARSRDQAHLPAWQAFNRSVGVDGTIGIFHETYIVQPEAAEALYGNMPVFGLAQATNHVPATGRRETARRRMGGESEPAVPSPANPSA